MSVRWPDYLAAFAAEEKARGRETQPLRMPADMAAEREQERREIAEELRQALADRDRPRLWMAAAAWVLWYGDSRVLSDADWVRIFRYAGYCYDARRVERPPAPVRMYRGAPASFRRGLGWSNDLETAARYAVWHSSRTRAPRVWVADVPPGALLASGTFTVPLHTIGLEHIKAEDPMGCTHHVVDPAGLVIIEYDGEPISDLAARRERAARFARRFGHDSVKPLLAGLLGGL